MTVPRNAFALSSRFVLACALTVGIVLSSFFGATSHLPLPSDVADFVHHAQSLGPSGQHQHGHDDADTGGPLPGQPHGHAHGHHGPDHSHETPSLLSLPAPPRPPVAQAWAGKPAGLVTSGAVAGLERPPRKTVFA